MAQAYKCDRCGRFEEGASPRVLEIYPGFHDASPIAVRKRLCYPCTVEIVAVVEAAPKA